jgi:hypothetical protein
MTARQLALVQALQHLNTAHRLLRDAMNLRALVAVRKAIRVVEVAVAQDRPMQPTLALEAPDDAPVV